MRHRTRRVLAAVLVVGVALVLAGGPGDRRTASASGPPSGGDRGAASMERILRTALHARQAVRVAGAGRPAAEGRP